MKRKSPGQDERLARAGRRIVDVSVLADEEAAALASSPFLFSRVRTAIKQELEADERGGIWASFWLISRKAIPAMGLAAALSSGLFLYTGNKSANAAFSVDAYLGTNDSQIDSLVFAERRPLTTEEVFETIVARDEREPAR